MNCPPRGLLYLELAIKPSHGNLCFSRRFVCRRMPRRLECPDKGWSRSALDDDPDFHRLRHRGARVCTIGGHACFGGLALAGRVGRHPSRLFCLSDRKLSHRRSWPGLPNRARLGSPDDGGGHVDLCRRKIERVGLDGDCRRLSQAFCCSQRAGGGTWPKSIAVR